MDQKIFSAVDAEILKGAHEFPTEGSPSKEMGEHARQGKKLPTSKGLVS